MYHFASCCYAEARLHNEKSFAALHWLDIKSSLLREGSDVDFFIPQIAIAIGVLTSNTRGRATNHFGGLDVAPGCHCRVQRTWCHCWRPLQGAIVVCYSWGGR